MKTVLCLSLVAVLVGCTAIVDSDIAPAGIGAKCTSSEQCQAGTCGSDGLCTSACAASTDCPETTQCFVGQCQKPLTVASMWVGVSSGGEGWTLTHEEGMALAATRLPWVKRLTKENIVSELDINASVDAFVAGGADVVVANSFSQRDAILKKADQYPNVKFLVAQSYKSNGRNADTFAAHGEQGWWVAGRVAGSKTLGSKQHRLGYVGSFITPELARHISAFYLGARSVDPDVKLEVQWMGFWSDVSPGPQFEYTAPEGAKDAGQTTRYYYEQLLTRRLIDHGATVIAHGADNQRTVKLIEDLAIPGVYSVSNDNANAYRALATQPDGTTLPTGAPLKTCLGSPYWNWGPLYVTILKEIHTGTWSPTRSRNESMTTDVAESVVGFNLNPIVGVDDPVVKGFVNDVASKGWQSVYAGPYRTTGQRDKDGDGQVDAEQTVAPGDMLTDAEYSRMCWFPEGIVERVPATSTDVGSERPARVPDRSFQESPASQAKIGEMTKAAFPGLSFDCNTNQ